MPKQSARINRIRGKRKNGRNDLTNHSFKTHSFCSNFMSRLARVTQLLPGQPQKSMGYKPTIYFGLASSVQIGNATALSICFLESHFGVVDMHRQVGFWNQMEKHCLRAHSFLPWKFLWPPHRVPQRNHKNTYVIHARLTRR